MNSEAFALVVLRLVAQAGMELQQSFLFLPQRHRHEAPCWLAIIFWETVIYFFAA